MAEVAPTTPEKKEGAPTPNPDVVEALNLLAQGKRNMLCKEVPQAVNQFQDACRLFAKSFGETAQECGEVYFCYGKALLELSRMESGVLGNALQGIDDEDDEEKSTDSEDKTEDGEKMTEEEKEKLSDEIIDSMVEREEEKPKTEKKEGDEKIEDVKQDGEAEKKEEADSKPKENGDVKEDEKVKEGGEVEENGEAKAETSGDKEEAKTDDSSQEGDAEKEEADTTADESEDIADDEGEAVEGEAVEGEEGESKEGDKKEEEDVSNLQLAWEMLELAKVIYSKAEGKEMKLRTAETCLHLGEVGLETEQYEQACEDFKKCLAIQKEYLEAEDRLIAETYYQLGLCYNFDTKYDAAVEHLDCAVKVIQAKLVTLKKVVEEGEKAGKGKEAASFDDPIVAAQKEIKDLEDIVPDILAKIEDCKDEQKNQEKVKQLVKENIATDMGATTTVGFGEVSSSSAEPAKPIEVKKTCDISHLVRKKRKPEDEGVEDSPAKKAKQENGDGDAAKAETNGKTESPQKDTESTVKPTEEAAMEVEVTDKKVEDEKEPTEEADKKEADKKEPTTEADKKEPTEEADKKEPTEAADKKEPTEAADMKEPTEGGDKKDTTEETDKKEIKVKTVEDVKKATEEAENEVEPMEASA